MVDYHDEWDEENGQYVGYPVLKKLSIFPIIPTVTYTLKF